MASPTALASSSATTTTANNPIPLFSPQPAQQQQPQPPSISTFTFLKQISSGAFGTVHLATLPQNPQKPYAIKAIKKEDLVRKNLTEKLSEERSALIKSRAHDFCVKLYYSLQTHTHVYFVMEYCIGGDLKGLLAHMNFFIPPMAAFYIAEVALALDYLHSKSIVHRDIKPDNMLLHKSGHVKLTDFGLSDVGLKSNLTMSPPAPGSSPFTPGQLASFGQPLTFSYYAGGRDSSSSSSLPSPIISRAAGGVLLPDFNNHNQSNRSSSANAALFETAHTPSSSRSLQQGQQPSVIPGAGGSSSSGRSSSLHPIQHSTPVGSFASTAQNNIPSVLHTKHRKVRIPLRKLGSRSHLTGSSNSSITDAVEPSGDVSGPGSSGSGSFLSSSWSIISSTEKENVMPQPNEESEQQLFNFKRVKLSPPKTQQHPNSNTNSTQTTSKPFQFDTSSFLNVSFNFSPQQQQQQQAICTDKITPPPKQPIPNLIRIPPSLSSPIQHSSSSPSISPMSPSSSSQSQSSLQISSFDMITTTPPPTAHQPAKNFTATSLVDNNNESSFHHTASPETGRLQHRTPSSHNHHNFFANPSNNNPGAPHPQFNQHSNPYYYSMPLIMEKSATLSQEQQQQQLQQHHNQALRENNQPALLSTFMMMKSPTTSSGVKSPSWPQQSDSMLMGLRVGSGNNNNDSPANTNVPADANKSRKRKLSENFHLHPYQAGPHHQQQQQLDPLISRSTGLTLEFSAIHLPQQGQSAEVTTPPPSQPQHQLTQSSTSEQQQQHSSGAVAQPLMYSTPVSSHGMNGIRLLGTPDYLAPELIRSAMAVNNVGGYQQEEHHYQAPTTTTCSSSAACDWWSLGVCFYEFVVGVLPFNDDTVPQVFSNILGRALDYPDGMDPELTTIMDGLMCSEAEGRFRLQDLKRFGRVFGNSDWWGRLKEMEVPFVPNIRGDMDTGYFD